MSARFQFVFYVSFLNEKSSIGLTLCRALHDYCERNGMNDFKLVVRLSEKDKTRWSEDFIRSTLANYKQDDLKRVWACGPPPMTETFDKAFMAIATDKFKGLDSSNLCVL